MNFIKLTVLFLVSICIVKVGYSQNVFTKTYDFGGIADGNECIEIENSGYVLVGRASGSISSPSVFSGVLVVRTNYDGEILWTSKLEHDYYNRPVILQSTSGAIILAFGSSGAGLGTDNLAVFKLGINGNIIWARKFNGMPYGTDRLDMVEDNNGNILIAGGGVGLMKIDSQGNYLGCTKSTFAWTSSSTTTGRTEIINTSDNGQVVVGRAVTGPGGQIGAIIFKVNSLGNIAWNKTFEDSLGYELTFSSVVENQSGDLIVLGRGQSHIILLKFNANGVLMWNKLLYSNDGTQHCHDLIQLPNGDLLIAGSAREAQLDFKGVLIKLDFLANIIWSKKFNFPATTYYNSALLTSDNGILLLGTSQIGPDGNLKMLLSKLDSTGSFECEEIPHPLSVSELTLIESTNFPIWTHGGSGQPLLYTNLPPNLLDISDLCAELETDNVGKNDELEIYPTPTSTSVSITSSSKIEEISVHYLDGRLIICQKELNTNSYNLNLSNLPAGTYYVFVRSIGVEAIRKVVKI